MFICFLWDRSSDKAVVCRLPALTVTVVAAAALGDIFSHVETSPVAHPAGCPLAGAA